MQLTLQDLQNAQIFLNRVEIKGNEAMAMAELQMKLQSMANAMRQPNMPAAPEPEAEPDITEPMPVESKAKK